MITFVYRYGQRYETFLKTEKKGSKKEKRARKCFVMKKVCIFAAIKWPQTRFVGGWLCFEDTN